MLDEVPGLQNIISSLSTRVPLTSQLARVPICYVNGGRQVEEEEEVENEQVEEEEEVENEQVEEEEEVENEQVEEEQVEEYVHEVRQVRQVVRRVAGSPPSIQP
ncbi:hypothetical protein FHG87_003671 [Trinorchestia longiramus]|nr:hypothetical protein FHG87_003671 [Trinorchestia longiramus]